MEVKDRAQYETLYQTQVSVLFDIRINYCMRSVHIWSFSGPYSVQMQENTKNSKYGHFSVRMMAVFTMYGEIMLE